MSTARTEPTVTVSSAAPADIDADLLALPVFGSDDLAEDVGDLAAASGGELARARASGEFRPKPRETLLVRTVGDAWRAPRVLHVAARTEAPDTAAPLREAAAVAARTASRLHVGRLAFVCRGDVDPARAAQAAAEGLVLGCFEDRRYKSDREEPTLRECVVVAGEAADADLPAAASRGRTLAAAANVARELAGEPSNVLTPRVFADRAAALVGEAGVGVEILDEEAIAALRMGLLLGVARGSSEPPRLLVMRHEPPHAKESPVLALVGKGVTFDTGGISIKPAEGMERMKEDMSGGAAVVGALRAIGQLRAPCRVIGLVPMTENMPGGRATKPGDILTGASGTTVEVTNTDAEGRLILADALWYARELGATHLVDVATLTGACIVALGHVSSGLFGRPAAWVDAVRGAGERAGESLWPLPVGAEYRELLRSEMADLNNVGGRPGGASSAAAFLEAFAGDLPWTHIDIAGTAWDDKGREDRAKGATGVMARTLASLALDPGAW